MVRSSDPSAFQGQPFPRRRGLLPMVGIELLNQNRGSLETKILAWANMPIQNWLANRVQTHVFPYLLAYSAGWHIRQALSPLLFDNDDPAAAEAQDGSVIRPA